MFWSSIIGGLKALTFWEVYVATLIFSFISIIPMIIGGLVGEKNETVGCLSSVIIAPIFYALGTLIFVFTLFPILLGFSGDAAWSFPWKVLFLSPWPMLKFTLIIVFATLFLSFIPVIGQIQSLHTFLSGAISLVLVLRILHSAYPNIPVEKIHLMPGILTLVGFLVIAGVVSWASTMFIALITTSFGEKALLLIAAPVGGVFGFIPVFIYGSYIGRQLTQSM